MTLLNHRLLRLQTAAAVVDGVALSTVVVHATVALAIPPAAVSAMLAGAATVALVVAPLSGGLMDRLGLRRTAALGALLTAGALVGYATAGAPAGLAVAIAVFMSAQAVSGAARQGLAVAGIPESERLQVRAAMHTRLNAGLGVGTLLGVLLLAGGDSGLRSGYLVAAAVSLAAGGLVLHWAAPARASAAAAAADQRVADHVQPTSGVLLALRDRRFAQVLALAVVLQLTMPILSVLLPVWVIRSTSAPVWTAALALAVNTMLVIVGQRWWSRQLLTDHDTVRSLRWAAFGVLVMGSALAIASSAGPTGALVLVVGAVVGLTLGEVAGGSAVWRVALDRVPAGAEGRYQAAYSMSSSAARIIGPLIALPLVIAAPRVGWLVLAVAMGVAVLAVGSLVRPRRTRSSSAVSASREGGDLRTA